MLERLGFPPIGDHGRFVTALVVDALGSGVFLPVSILYFLASTPLSLVQIGLALSLASALQLPLAPMLGGLVDRLGAKSVLLTANVTQAIGFVGYLVADSFPAVLAASAVVQVGQTAFWGSFSPMVAAISEPGERERWFGFLGALRNASLAVGGLVAALAITIGTERAYSAVVLLNAGSYLVAYMLLLSVPSTHPGTQATNTGAPAGWRQVLADRPYLLLVATNFTFATSALAFNLAMPVYFTVMLDLPGWVTGAVFTLNTAMIGLGQGLVVNAMTGSTRSNIVALGSVLLAASYAVLLAGDRVPMTAGIAVVLTGAVVFTAGELVAGPVLSALATDAAPPHLRGRYISLYQLSWTFALTVCPVALTWLLDHGALPLWGTLAAVAMVGAGLSLVLRRVLPQAALPVSPSRPDSSSPHDRADNA